MTTNDLADRLTRLERENRRLKRVGAVVLIGIVAAVVMGQTTREVGNEVVASRFVLRLGAGPVLAKLEPDSQGKARLIMGDKECLNRKKCFRENKMPRFVVIMHLKHCGKA